MVIENKKTIIAIQLRKLLLIVILAIVVVLLFYYELFKETFGFEQKYAVFVLIFLYVVYYFWGLVCDYHYFYYSDLSPSKLVFRYYSLAPLSKRQHSVELKKEDFYNYGIETKMWGLRRYLVIYQRTLNGIAKYPPISISLLNHIQVKDLSFTLSQYKKKA